MKTNKENKADNTSVHPTGNNPGLILVVVVAPVIKEKPWGLPLTWDGPTGKKRVFESENLDQKGSSEKINPKLRITNSMRE